MKKYLLYRQYGDDPISIKCFTSSMLVLKNKLADNRITIDQFGNASKIDNSKIKSTHYAIYNNPDGSTTEDVWTLYELNVRKDGVVVFVSDDAGNVDVLCGNNYHDALCKFCNDSWWHFKDKDKIIGISDILSGYNWATITCDNFSVDLKVMSEKVNNLPDNKNYSDWCFAIEL